MNLGRLFYWTNQWLVIGGALGLLLLASEIGWRIGRNRCTDDKLHAQVSAISAAVLVFGVIMDLNRPHRGMIQTGQNSMLRLRKSLAEKDVPLRQRTLPLDRGLIPDPVGKNK